MDRTKNYIIGTLIALSLMISIAEVIVGLNEGVISGRTYSIWGVVFIILLAIWAQQDARQSQKHYPFEYGYLAYLFWPFMIPHHFISTRGFKGVGSLFGLLLVYMAPLITGGVTYVFFT